jgi:hypothetical protein
LLPAKFNACAYATDFPPGAYYTTPTSVDFKGTLPFYITYNDGTTVTVTSKTNYTPISGKTITAVTDATACPGIIAAIATNSVTGANAIANDYSNMYILNGSNTSAPVTERGFLYSSSDASPTTATGTKLTVSSGTGTMSYNWVTTAYSTIFYIRAYAISNGTVMYGSVTSFRVWSAWYYEFWGNASCLAGIYSVDAADNTAAPCYQGTVPANTLNLQRAYPHPYPDGTEPCDYCGDWTWVPSRNAYVIFCTSRRDGDKNSRTLYLR